MTTATKRLLYAINNSVMLTLFFISFAISAQLNTNGSFENSAVDTVSGTDVEGWVIEMGNGADAVFQIVDDTVQSGNRAMKITVNAIGSNAWDIQVIGDSIPAQQGETYRYSIWAKSSGSSQVNFTVGNYSYTEYANIIRPSAPNVTTKWQEYTFEFTVTDAVDYIRAPLHFSIAANTGDSIYIDNFKIINVKDEMETLKPVIVEAESGITGSYFSTQQDGDVTYITTTVDFTGLSSPDDTNRVATYNVTFLDSGYYSLFARLRVGPGNFNDDSFFYPRGFGEKNDTASADWVFVNGLASAGFSGPGDIVDGPGGAGSEVWKWVNVTNNTYSGVPGDTFFVSLDSLTRTFQIASREDGLYFDKFAFGKSYLNYTVENLDSVEAGSVGEPVEVWNGPALASSQPKFVGNIYSAPQINNFVAYWNQVTPENAGKWGSVEGVRNNMNWNALDAAYNLAKDNDLPFDFHVLIWGAQQPAWIDTLQPADQLAEIREWFQAVADRYDNIDYLQVVNEPLPGHNPPDGTNGRANYKAALGGNGDTGWDWVVNAFKMAREIFPAETKLMINDFGILGNTSSTAQYLSLIRLLQSQDLIDVIGVQGHAFTTGAPVVSMQRTLDSLATTGLPIQVTELDIDGPSDAIQLQDYQRIFPALYEHPGVMGITLWGWRPGLWRETAYLVNNDGSERPALEWLHAYLDSVDVTVSVEDPSKMPFAYQLYNNYPNPFNPSTTISFDLPQSSDVKLIVYDLLGRKVSEIFKGNMNAGHHETKFNASKLSSGIYFYKLEAGGFVSVKKMMLMK